MRLLLVSEVSEILRIPKILTYRLIKQGAIPSIRIGKRIRVPEERLREWIESGGITLEEMKKGNNGQL